MKRIFFLTSSVVLSAGSLAMVAFWLWLLSKNPGGNPFSMAGLFAWNLCPFVASAAVAGRTRNGVASSLVAAFGCLISVVIGVGLTFKAFFLDPPDAQSALVVLVAPFYQLLASSPFLLTASLLKKDTERH
ncbi:hypothetical protein [Planctomicrobium piriforme]|uniref:hypothetical protein n=1 Tax=Planctomicrobium piriforme TaxID=1576369 RepID=UPI00111401F0|nr:hypothetical protein [Planctomicrobium piriforme]